MLKSYVKRLNICRFQAKGLKEVYGCQLVQAFRMYQKFSNYLACGLVIFVVKPRDLLNFASKPKP